jgi:hypothetical protein
VSRIKSPEGRLDDARSGRKAAWLVVRAIWRLERALGRRDGILRGGFSMISAAMMSLAR